MDTWGLEEYIYLDIIRFSPLTFGKVWQNFRLYNQAKNQRIY